MDEIYFLRRLVETYSPSGQEKDAVKYLTENMNTLGFQTRQDAWGNAWGSIGSGTPYILLCGHVDTVPGEIPVRIDGETLHGRGSVDAKSAMAAMVLAAHRFSQNNLPGTILVAGVVGEEAEGAGDKAGIQGVLNQNLEIDYAIFGEPTGINRITIGYRGRIGVRITCFSEESHAASPSPTNSIEGILEAVRRLREFANSKKSMDDEFESVTLTPTLISGGKFHNMVPGRCEVFVDIRVPPRIKNEGLVNEIQKIISSLEGQHLGYELKMVDSTPSYEAPKTSLIVRALIRAILTETSLRPRLTRKWGTGDMNVLGSHLKIPVATYGPGDARLSHTPQEALDLNEYTKSISVYLRALTYISKTHNRL